MRPARASTLAAAILLALAAAACTSPAPPEATPPPEATTPAPASTPTPPTREPTPAPTPEVQWDENGLPLGVKGPLIALHDGDHVRIVTAAGRLLNSIKVRHSVRLGGERIAYIDNTDAWLVRPDGRRERLTSALGRVTYALPAPEGHLALTVSAAHSGPPRPDALSVVIRRPGSEMTTPYSAFGFTGGFEPLIAFWHGSEEVVVASISGTEMPPQFATLSTDGETAILGEPAVPTFSPDLAAWGRSVDPFRCLELGSTTLAIDPLFADVAPRTVEAPGHALRLVTIAPGGAEFVYSRQPLAGDGNECRWVLAPEQLVHVDSRGTETTIDSLTSTLERWGLLPPFEVECAAIPYPFCPASHEVAIDQFGRVVFSPDSAYITVLGTIDLPPP